MKISLIPQDSSLTPLSLEGTLTFPHGERRMSRNKLVTGGVKIIDRGQTFKDRVASMVLTLTSAEDEQTIVDWYNNRSLLMFSDSLGVYSCKIYSLNILFGVATLEMWITELIVSSEDYIYPPPYVPGYFVDYVHSTYWDDATGYNGVIWTGDKVNLGIGVPTGGWSDYYQPLKIRLTFTGAEVVDIAIYERDHGGTSSFLEYIYYPPGNLVSGTVYNISPFSLEELSHIVLGIIELPGYIELSGVEFWVEGTPPAAKTWTDYTSDSYWTCTSGGSAVWDGSKWVVNPAAGSAAFDVLGVWSTGLKPAKVRITYSGNSGSMSNQFVWSPGGPYIVCFGNSYVSLSEMPVNQSFTDAPPSVSIDHFQIDSSLVEGFNIDKIEFLI